VHVRHLAQGHWKACLRLVETPGAKTDRSTDCFDNIWSNKSNIPHLRCNLPSLNVAVRIQCRLARHRGLALSFSISKSNITDFFIFAGLVQGSNKFGVCYLLSYTITSGVRRLDGARGKKQVWRPCSNVRSFGSKCTVLKKVLVTLLGFFSAPRSDSAPGELFPP